jgi:hypothetical protein
MNVIFWIGYWIFVLIALFAWANIKSDIQLKQDMPIVLIVHGLTTILVFAVLWFVWLPLIGIAYLIRSLAK